jgi:hypothetical protein
MPRNISEIRYSNVTINTNFLAHNTNYSNRAAEVYKDGGRLLKYE